MKRLLSILLAALCAACTTTPPAETAAHPEWSYNAVVYEMNVRQYTPEGTFAAAARELPRLKRMGADIIWLMPIHPIGVKERKGTLGSYYAISDYCAVNPEFGTLDEFDRFVAEAHRLGLRVILDWVANHTSPDARWITERPADWYVRDSLGRTIVQYDWTDIAKLNYDNADMRQEMERAMRFWLERGIDGFRCDMACEVPIDFWRTTLPALRRDYPQIFLLAEGEDPALHEGAFDASYSWELHHLMNDIARGKRGVAELKEYLKKDAANTPHEAFRLMFTSNHDENSWAGSEFERMGDAARVMALLTFTLPKGACRSSTPDRRSATTTASPSSRKTPCRNGAKTNSGSSTRRWPACATNTRHWPPANGVPKHAIQPKGACPTAYSASRAAPGATR